MASMSSEAEVVETQKQSMTVDMFSLLPDDLLIHVISFLPTKYAVFTSILSQRWKLLWCYAGKALEFDDKGIRYDESGFRNFVDRVLMLYKVPLLERFSLRCDAPFVQGHRDCHQLWIEHVLNKRKAKEVEVYLGQYMCRADILRAQVFNSEALQVLKLVCLNRSSVGDSDDANVCLPNLKILHICFVPLHLRPRLFNNFLSGAPRLEEAFLGALMFCSAEQGYDFEYHLRSPSLKRLRLSLQTLKISARDFVIDAPLLEEFSIDDQCFRHHVLKGMSSLVTAKVNVGVSYFRKIQHMPNYFDWTDELLQGLASVRFLYLSGCTMDVLSMADHHNLPQFSNLSCLQIRVLNYFAWNALPSLLQNAPNLKVLVLKKDLKHWRAKFNKDSIWHQLQVVPGCLSKTLYEIEIWDCEARQVELDLISYLLQNGKVLNTLMVDLLPHSSEEQLRFCEKIMMIPKDSGTCQIQISALHSSYRWSNPSPEKSPEQLSIPQQLTYKELDLFTDGFDSKNLISTTPLSKIYRGKIPQHGSDLKGKLVTVKEWIIAERNLDYRYNDYCLLCFHDELKLLQHPNFSSHPYFLRLHGYSVEDDNKRLAVVYDFEPLDTLENLIPKGLACILEYMHKKTETIPTVLQNLDAAYIMVDQDCNPVLFDFSCVSGGIFPIRQGWPNACRFEDWDQECDRLCLSDRYDRFSDIFAYGIILLRLISKRAYERDYLKRKESGDPGTYGWAEKEYWPRYTDIVFRNQRKISLVHQSLRAHPTFDFADGLKITSLAMRCVDFSVQRPRMKGIVKSLLKLNVVRQYWDFLDCDKMLSFLDVEFLSQG